MCKSDMKVSWIILLLGKMFIYFDSVVKLYALKLTWTRLFLIIIITITETTLVKLQGYLFLK